MSKNKTKITIAVIIIALALIAGGLIAWTVTSSEHNKKVEAVAEEYNEALDTVTLDFTQPVDKNKAFSNITELSIMKNERQINKEALTYADGSECKYNEIQDKLNNLITQYQDYFTNNHENVYNGNDIDINAATKDELNTALTQLTQLKTEVEETLNSTIWDEDPSWSIIWGNDKEEAKDNYYNFKSKIENKINEIKTRLDQINAEEAQAAAAAHAAATTSGNNNSSGNSSEGSGYNNRGNTGGGGSYNPGTGGGGGDTPGGGGVSWWQASLEYGQYVQDCISKGMTSWLSFEEWCHEKGYHF